jgi:hypothetical protein
MGQSAKPTRQNRTITVDFQEPSTYLQLPVLRAMEGAIYRG